MAQRPWIEPQDVKNYSELPIVQDRDDEKLRVDISRAEQYVIAYTNNRFESEETIPEAVKTACILLAESYVYNAYLSHREEKSVTFDDYSASFSENGHIDVKSLDLGALLDDYIIATPKKGVNMRIRRL